MVFTTLSPDVRKLLLLRDKLRLFQKYKKENRLYFMEWEKYPAQNDMRNLVLDRMISREGPYIFVVFGANRSGKSELGGGLASEVAINPDNRYGKDLRLWCATISDISVKVQQKKIFDIIPHSELTYGEYNAVRGWKNNVITTKNGSTLYFKTYEQGEGSFQGETLDFVWLDEECPWSIYSEVVMRIGDRSGVIVLTFTSLMGFTRLVNLLWESNNPNVRTCILTARDNPFLTNTAKAQLKASIDRDELESRWEGKPHMKTGLIYKGFSEHNKIDDFDYISLYKGSPDKYEITEGIDPHDRTPHHWIRFFYDKENDFLYIVDELKAPKESMIIGDFARLIRIKRQKITPLYTQIDTSAQKPIPIMVQRDEYQEDSYTIRRAFTDAGIDTQLCVKDNAIGIHTVKDRIKVVKTQTGIVKRPPKLYVFRSCVGTLWEFARYSWDSYQSAKIAENKEMMNKPIKKDDHFMDIIKYECIKRGPVVDDAPILTGTAESYPGTGY